jgi:hypothetical protein
LSDYCGGATAAVSAYPNNFGELMICGELLVGRHFRRIVAVLLPE